MSEQIFRKKTLDKVKSPETLDDYIRVANPGVWLLLIAIIALLIGACFWGIYGHIDSTVPVTVYVAEGSGVCYVAEEHINVVQVGSIVKFSNAEGVITDVRDKDEKGYICIFETDNLDAAGWFEAELVLDRVRPASFIVN